jgi:NADPH-dependent F420 reductase
MGLAARLAAAGEDVIIGSRSRERGETAAAELRTRLPEARISGADNETAAEQGDVILVAVPYEGQRATLEALRPRIGDKIVIDVVVPLVFEKGKAPRTAAVPEGSAAEEARAVLPDARVTSAFHNLSAHVLQDLEQAVDADVLVCGDDQEAKRYTMELAEKLRGVRGIDAGPLSNSRYVEDLTALLLYVNRKYKAHSGVRITGV